MIIKEDVVSDKETANFTVQMQRFYDLPSELKKQIELVQLHITAGEPIPVRLHNAVSAACNAWHEAQLKMPYKDDKVYNLVYTVHLWILLNQREGSKRAKEDAFEAAKEHFGKNNAGDIYKAVSNNVRLSCAAPTKFAVSMRLGCWPVRVSPGYTTSLISERVTGQPSKSVLQFEEISLALGIGGLVLYMVFVMYKLAKESGAGPFVTPRCFS